MIRLVLRVGVKGPKTVADTTEKELIHLLFFELISGAASAASKKQKPSAGYQYRYFGIPAVSVRPLGFPPHPHEWFSIVDYRIRFFGGRRLLKSKKPGPDISIDISASRLSQ
jgi:hypothetical protein